MIAFFCDLRTVNSEHSRHSTSSNVTALANSALALPQTWHTLPQELRALAKIGNGPFASDLGRRGGSQKGRSARTRPFERRLGPFSAHHRFLRRTGWNGIANVGGIAIRSLPATDQNGWNCWGRWLRMFMYGRKSSRGNFLVGPLRRRLVVTGGLLALRRIAR